MPTAPPDLHHNEIAEAGKTIAELRDYSDVPTEETHWRMCYHRAGSDWRLRDERGSVKSLWLVEGYLGETVMNWLDGGSHVFTDNPVWIDPETRIAHFYRKGKVCECGQDHN